MKIGARSMAGTGAHTRLVQPLRNGQITIPADFRHHLGITQDTLLEVTLEGGALRITPIQARATAGGSSWFAELYDEFTPVRAEAAKYPVEETEAAIDKAVAAVRKRRAGRS